MKNALHQLLLILIVLILLSDSLYSKEYFKVIDNTAGLPDNSVNCISQDAQGYIWMGTANGLCRYDGMLFDTFRHDAENPFSLSNNNVHKIVQTNNGFFVASDKGVDYYSFSDGLFHHCSWVEKGKNNLMQMGINSMVLSNGRLFVADESGNTFASNGELSKCSFLRIKNGVNINAINKYKNGLLVGVGPNGVYLLSSDVQHVLGYYAVKIHVNHNLNIYYSKNADIVYVGNGIGYSSQAIKINGRHLSISGDLSPANLMSVVDYRDKTVFGVDGGGVIFKDKKTMNRFTPLNSNLSGDAVYSLFADRNGTLWAGTYRSGVNCYSNSSSSFYMLDRTNKALTYSIVTAVCPDGDNIYVGLDGGGLNIYNIKTKSTRCLKTADSNIAGDNILSVIKDADNIWMDVYTKGLVQYSVHNASFSLYPMPKTKKGDENDVWTMCDDGMGNIWMGGPNIAVFNKASHKIYYIKELIGSDCSSIQCKGRYIWIGSNHNGIYKVDKYSKKVVRHYTDKSDIKLPSNEVKYIFMDSRGILWFSLSYMGFCSLDEKTGRVESYGLDEGLTNTSVASISEDNSGKLWLGTFNGLFRFDSKTKTFVRFDTDEHISSTFTYNSSFYDGKTMYFGSTKGLVYFKPSEIHCSQTYNGVGISSIELINNDNKVFNLYGGQIDKIKLDYDQNFFTIHFSVPEIETPNRVHFSCYLKGLEDGWRELAGAREVSYTNVPPGKYDFLVRCTDSNGHWTKPTIFHITVTPPWWKTPIAVALWTILILVGIAASLWFYLHELDIKHRIHISEIEKSTMKKLNDAKMNFYTNIIHELRTPVFLIAAQIEELMDVRKSVVQVPSSYLYAMYRSSTKLNNLISRIIDFRKMDSDKQKLALQTLNVVDFCQNLNEDYVNLFDQKNISYSFNCKQENIQLTFDAEKLEMIISNLISNAFKYTKDSGSVSLTIEDTADDVVFSVKDNGIGIMEKMRDTIFESFFRTERGEKQSSGDGIGLSVVKSLVELHGGTIRVESEVNKGSEFIFNIPKGISNVMPHKHIAMEKDDLPVAQKQNIQTLDNPLAIHSILLIDDEHETVDILERYFTSDFKIYKAYDGVQGFKIAEENLPDIIICDIMMPNMDGIQFLSKIKADKKLAHIKIVIFTAKTSEEDMLEALDKGADAYITKPVSLKVLRKRIDKLINQRETGELADSIAEQKKGYTKEEQIFLLKCREVIDDNINNDNFSIEFLAEKLAMSHSSLYKKIKVMTGMSLIEFINDYKIYKAVQIFKTGVSNIESVSLQCGFKDVKNFREMFKRKMKVTPKQFVQSL